MAQKSFQTYPSSAWARYKLRWRRKRLLWRAFRKRREVLSVNDQTSAINTGDILLFATVRNEMLRLPHFFKHYRALGVSHFLIVDNESHDGTTDYLLSQPDVSLWVADAGYKASRFGMDWVTWLQRKYAHGHWTLTVDADELLIYPDHDNRTLPDLTKWLDRTGYHKVGALMLDMYPQGPTNRQNYSSDQEPMGLLQWFDAFGYWAQIQPKMGNLWLQGGARARCFFQEDPRRAPTLNKIPLVKWHRSYVYVNSTHNALPPKMNVTYDEGPVEKLHMVLLHTKFLPDVAERAGIEKARGEHFANGALYADYYDALQDGPDLWSPDSVRYTGWKQLVDLGLMFHGGWLEPDTSKSLRKSP